MQAFFKLSRLQEQRYAAVDMKPEIFNSSVRQRTGVYAHILTALVPVSLQLYSIRPSYRVAGEAFISDSNDFFLDGLIIWSPCII